MSEEIRKQGAELDESALSGVSGGAEASPSSAMESARRYCAACDKSNLCKHASDLARYLESMGIDSLANSRSCPYYLG